MVTNCVNGRATELLDSVLSLHGRALVKRCAESYSVGDESQMEVVRALVDLAAAGRKSTLIAHLVALGNDPGALWLFLRLFHELATYDKRRRVVIIAEWPSVMGAILDETAAGRDVRKVSGTKSSFRRLEAFSLLILRPQLSMGDADPDATLADARTDWISLGTIRPMAERWLPEVVGSHDAVDDTIGFLRTLPSHEQVDPGLRWITQIINGNYSLVSRSWLLPDWIREVRAFVSRHEDLTRYRTLIDGCAATGDHRFVSLQQAEER